MLTGQKVSKRSLAGPEGFSEEVSGHLRMKWNQADMEGKLHSRKREPYVQRRRGRVGARKEMKDLYGDMDRGQVMPKIIMGS